MHQTYAIRSAQEPGVNVPALQWRRTFPGDPGQVRTARHWIEGILPDSEPRDSAAVIANELCANAIQHTASGTPGGTFTLDVSWWPVPGFVRVAAGDQGGPSKPRVVWNADGETSRGLRLIHGLSARWGVTGNSDGRWVWADIPWVAPGGQPVPNPDGTPPWKDAPSS